MTTEAWVQAHLVPFPYLPEGEIRKGDPYTHGAYAHHSGEVPPILRPDRTQRFIVNGIIIIECDPGSMSKGVFDEETLTLGIISWKEGAVVEHDHNGNVFIYDD